MLGRRYQWIWADNAGETPCGRELNNTLRSTWLPQTLQDYKFNLCIAETKAPCVRHVLMKNHPKDRESSFIIPDTFI